MHFRGRLAPTYPNYCVVQSSPSHFFNRRHPSKESTVFFLSSVLADCANIESGNGCNRAAPLTTHQKWHRRPPETPPLFPTDRRSHRHGMYQGTDDVRREDAREPGSAGRRGPEAALTRGNPERIGTKGTHLSHEQSMQQQRVGHTHMTRRHRHDLWPPHIIDKAFR